MRRNILTALACSWLLPAHAASVDLKALLTDSDIKWASDTVISFPDTTEFEDATVRWNSYNAPTYAGAISPADEEDVVKVVKFAKEHSVPFLATGGRHGCTDMVGLQEGLAIDLSQVNSYTLDSDDATITVGAGSTFGQFQNAIYDAGFMIQSGSVTCPGFIGITLGGGIGRYTGIFGLEIDALVSARIVTADGEVLTISETENEELFWGVRGAGFNFGIIISATFKLHRLADNNNGEILTADFIIPANKTLFYFDWLESLSETMPPNAAGVSRFQFDSTAKEGQIGANWVFIGPEDEGREFLSPILDLQPSIAMLSNVPWNKLIETAGGGQGAMLCEARAPRSLYTSQMRKYSASALQETFNKISTLWETYPGLAYTSLNFESFPNHAVAAVPDEATAYPWRDAIGWFQFEIISLDGVGSDSLNAGEQTGQALRDSWVRTSGYENHTIYVNYARGDETLEQKYGASKLPRLAALKKKYDPDNVFGWNNALPTEYPGSG
ncbi:FAD-binding oxidoreductase [Aspergillus glaucus CBS 516.65]|uniref:FAD-binding PCMH-type domain-containing protein n=1 Tax=Aspergillus glaucus CBS 516.65 TaxID=1160497 RepID=A0A1L9VI90_ASPGL|nr:hypothetical protein ASPGLDRAFT_26518 [Aspergillus glaucus CBS 516.65]OJJ83639.1 hypothetical protein ASPGLDRAFT_26518 [Aspergillus glaucus CBS 516.65]